MRISRMIARPVIFVATVLCAVTCAAQSEKNETSANDRVEAAHVTVVVPLRHAEAHAVHHAIESLEYPVRCTVAGDTNIILRGDPEIIRQIQSEFLVEIDVPKTGNPSGNNRMTRIFPLDHHPTEEFVDLLHAATANRSTRIAFDGQNRIVVVGGPKSDIDAVHQVIESSRKPRASLSVSLYFIRGRIGADGDAADKLPKSLYGVGRALEAGGFTDLSLLSPVILTVEQGREFQHKAAIQGTTIETHRDELIFSVSGVAQLSEYDSTVKISVDARVHGEYTAMGHKTEGRTMFEAETTIVAKLDEFVVLAASPASTANGTAIALAVYISRN